MTSRNSGRICSVIGFVLSIGLGLYQSGLAQDSTGVVDPKNALEFRLSSGTAFEIQYSRKWWPFLSTDVMLQTTNLGPSVGLTFYPVSFFFVQGRVGYPMFEDHVEDAAPWDPDLMYAYRVGFGIPSMDERFYVQVSYGQLWVANWDYCYTCGFIPPDVTFTPQYRDEIEMHHLISIGVGSNF